MLAMSLILVPWARPKVLMFLDGQGPHRAYKTLLYPGVDEISHYALRVHWVYHIYLAISRAIFTQIKAKVQ